MQCVRNNMDHLGNGTNLCVLKAELEELLPVAMAWYSRRSKGGFRNWSTGTASSGKYPELMYLPPGLIRKERTDRRSVVVLGSNLCTREVEAVRATGSRPA